MGSSKQSTTSSQTTQPWAPTIPLLQNQFLPAINNQFPNYTPTPYQNNAISGLESTMANLPNYGGAATGVTNSLLSGDPSNLLRPALSNYNSQVSPIANMNLDPTQAPGMGNVLNTIRNDVSNSVNGMFAGAGRDLSGLNAQYLARGLAQGEAQPLLNQYNANIANRMGAAQGMLGAANNTAGAMTGNQQQGVNLSTMLPQISGLPFTSQLGAAQQAFGLPLQNLAQLEALTLPIAGLGQQSNGQSTTTSTPSVFSDILSGIGTVNSLFSPFGMMG